MGGECTARRNAGKPNKKARNSVKSLKKESLSDRLTMLFS